MLRYFHSVWHRWQNEHHGGKWKKSKQKKTGSTISHAQNIQGEFAEANRLQSLTKLNWARLKFAFQIFWIEVNFTFPWPTPSPTPPFPLPSLFFFFSPFPGPPLSSYSLLSPVFSSSSIPSSPPFPSPPLPALFSLSLSLWLTTCSIPSYPRGKIYLKSCRSSRSMWNLHYVVTHFVELYNTG